MISVCSIFEKYDIIVFVILTYSCYMETDYKLIDMFAYITIFLYFYHQFVIFNISTFFVQVSLCEIV